MNQEVQIPIVTAEKFADLVGLPLGVVEAQLDRRILPCVRIGKRRFVNIEALRLMSIEAAQVTSGLSLKTKSML